MWHAWAEEVWVPGGRWRAEAADHGQQPAGVNV